MEAQYIQFSKKEGRFVLQQKARNTEKKYQIEQDKEAIVSALFYEDYIKQHIENEEMRNNLLTLIKSINDNITEKNSINPKDDEKDKEKLLEFQLRRDKEIGEKEEEKKYHNIKQIILPTLQ